MPPFRNPPLESTGLMALKDHCSMAEPALYLPPEPVVGSPGLFGSPSSGKPAPSCERLAGRAAHQ